MKRILMILFVILIVLPAAIIGGCYGAIRFQYRETFMPGLFVNGIYAADMTPQQMNDKLKENALLPTCIITDAEGEEHSFSMEEADFREDYLEELQNLHKTQSVLKFVNWFLESGNVSYQEKQLLPVVSYDHKKLTAYLDGCSYLKDNSEDKNRVIEIRRDADGYYLYDETQNLLNHEKAVKAIETALDDQEYEIDLTKADCYETFAYTSQMKQTLALWDALSPYMNAEITYKSSQGDYVIDRKKVSDLLAQEDGELLLDEAGKPYLDEKRMQETVKELAEHLNTVGKPRSFRATRGVTVTVETGTYGCRIDEEEELAHLYAAVPSGRVETRTPVYKQMSYTGIDGLDDIGSTYIEVDMTDQMMYYYVNGRQELSTPVVTGNTSLGRGTPQKVCYIYFKQRNRVLRGEDYATPVSYWMAVYGNIGIHDATWRRRFGGTIYKTGGSHGCINTPFDEVSKLYDMAEVGTPVIIFY